MDSPDIDSTQPYYVLKPLFNNCVVSTPVNNTQVVIRSIISKDEAERLIDTIPSIHAEPYLSRVQRELSDHYGAILNTHDCAKLIELTMSIHAKKQSLERQNRKFMSLDEQFMKRAEDLLFGELSAALGIPKDNVPAYIASRVERGN